MTKTAEWRGSIKESLPIEPESYLSSASTEDLVQRTLQLAYAVCGPKVVDSWKFQTWSDFAVVAISTDSMERDFPKVSVDDVRHYKNGRQRKEDAAYLRLNTKQRDYYRKTHKTSTKEPDYV
jgi:hypothetical protein